MLRLSINPEVIEDALSKPFKPTKYKNLVSTHADISQLEKLNKFPIAEELKLAKAKLDYYFDNAKAKLYYDVRNSLFPQDISGSKVFKNRAGDKLYEILNATKLFTSIPKNCVFIDICGGPGAFSEVLFKTLKLRTSHISGYGITLYDTRANWYADLFNKPFTAIYSPEHIIRTRAEYAELHKEIKNKRDGNKNDKFDKFDKFAKLGDIFVKENVQTLYRVIEEQPYPVKFVVSDGGFKVSTVIINNRPVHIEHLQEIYSQRLILTELLISIETVAKGGHAVCKLFDTFTEFTKSLIYLVGGLFNSAYLLKPEYSRDVNSERYLVLKKFKAEKELTEAVIARLKLCYDLMETAILDTVLKFTDNEFEKSFAEYTEKMARKQIATLNKITDEMMRRDKGDKKQ